MQSSEMTNNFDILNSFSAKFSSDNSTKKNYHTLLFFEPIQDYSHPEAGFYFAGRQDIDNGPLALYTYMANPSPATQLLSASSRDELDAQVKEMKENFKNPEWIKTNILSPDE